MKGVVFKELLELVEEKFGEEKIDNILDQIDLDSGGAYTSVGTYDYQEILQIVTKLSEETSIPIPDLVKTFGQHLTSVFLKGYPDFFKQPNLFKIGRAHV